MRMSPYMKMHQRRILKHRSALRAAMLQVARSRGFVTVPTVSITN